MAGTMEIQNDRKAENDQKSGTTESDRNSGTTGNDRTNRNDLPTFATLGEGRQSHCRNNKTSRISFLSVIPIWFGAPEYWPSIKESAVFFATETETEIWRL
jgi:hypothetical protein